MKMKTLIALFLLALMAGCVTQTQTVEQPHPAFPLRHRVDDARVVIDPKLAQIIQLVGLTSTNTADGFLKIQLDIQNMTDANQQFVYRIDWYDQNAQPLSMAALVSPPWFMLKRETSFLGATSPTPAARDFRVHLTAATMLPGH